VIILGAVDAALHPVQSRHARRIVDQARVALAPFVLIHGVLRHVEAARGVTESGKFCSVQMSSLTVQI
jgi:hypothetical protein